MTRRPLTRLTIGGLVAACTLAALPLPQSSRPAATYRLADLAWMVGDWRGPHGATLSTEYWFPSEAGAMFGVNRTIADDKVVFFEFLRLVETKEGVIYFAHPRGRTETPFRLSEVNTQRAVFENPAHDFPQKVTYWRDGDALHAKIEGVENGKPAQAEWKWTRHGQ